MDDCLDPGLLIPRQRGTARDAALAPLPLQLSAVQPAVGALETAPRRQLPRLRARPLRCRVMVVRVGSRVADITSYVFML